MFIWDAANTNHVAQHGIAPEEAEQVIDNDPLDIERQERNGELRSLHLGETLAGRVLFVVVTVRGEDIRVVTAWPASRQARSFYIEQRELQHGEEDRDP